MLIISLGLLRVKVMYLSGSLPSAVDDYACLSRTHGIFMKVNHLLGCKTSTDLKGCVL